MPKTQTTVMINRRLQILIQILILLLFQGSQYSLSEVLSEEKAQKKQEVVKGVNKNESCNLSSLDSTVQWIFYFQHPTRKIPRNLTELHDFCLRKDDIENTVSDYSKTCLESVPRTVTELLMFGVRRQNRYYCSTSSKAKSDYLDSAKCLEIIKKPGGNCMNSLIIDMLSVLSSATEKRIGRLCCVYYRFEDCIMLTTQEKCLPRQGKRIEDLLHGYTGQMLSNMCLNYPKETDCLKIYPKREWNKARKSAEKRFKPLPKSILPPLIDVISSLPF